MRNRGVEVTVAWRDRIGKLGYDVSINGSYNKTRLEKWSQLLTRGATYTGSNNISSTVFINMPYNYVYTYVDNGIAQTWNNIYHSTPQGDQPGDIVRQDLNGDGKIDGNDQVALQNPRDRPTTSFALNANASYRGFDAGMLWTGTAGRKDFWLNAFNNTNFNSTRYAVNENDVTLPWSVENRGGWWPRIGGNSNNTAQTTFWLYDMSYLRLKNVHLAYTFPRAWFQRLGVSTFRVAVLAENLWTLTRYPGLDPEKAGSNNNLYPLNKSYSVNAQLSF
jgi:hypothetical protein